ncbi:MAG TPA: cation diffusion facilitator family transporter [Candidatus Thermoplasmatota archaeon]|nr:cation diffusion facilitator family transporter [Candidatus Thermoplasmatota archaeon]
MEHAHARGDRTADPAVHAHKLRIALALALLVLALEVAAYVRTGSLAILSDAGHLLIDISALTIAYGSARLAQRPPTERRSYGHHRIEILAGLANGILLLGVGGFVFSQAIPRLASPPAVHGETVSLVGMAAIVSGLAGAYILRESRHASLNVKAAYFHVLSDVASSAAVVAAGLGIALTGLYVLDPLAGIAIGALIVYGGIRLLREAGPILLQAAPPGLDPERIRRAVVALEGVASVHDLHLWSLTPGRHVATMHVVVDSASTGRRDEVTMRVIKLLHDDFGIEHATIQAERENPEHPGVVHA